jgi:hypothetical protein
MFNPGTIAPQSYMFGPNEVLQQFEGTEAQFDATGLPELDGLLPGLGVLGHDQRGHVIGRGADVTNAAALARGLVRMSEVPPEVISP